jgi:uncharacterized RDD family membrane protein YckC
MLNYSEAGYGKQIMVGLIDSSLSIALATFLILKMPEGVSSYLKDVNGTLLVLVMFVLYRLLFLLFLNQTVGMRVFRVVLLNGEEQPLSFLEKTLAAIFILFRGTGYYQLKQP